MIIDEAKNMLSYAPLLPNLRAGLDAVKALGEDLEPGRYEFPGGYFMVQEGEAKPLYEGDFEAHRKYIDVQILLEGTEYVAFAPTGSLTVTKPYSEERDIFFLTGKEKQLIRFERGMFWAAFPQDAHKPGRYTDTPAHYKKIIMKLPLA